MPSLRNRKVKGRTGFTVSGKILTWDWVLTEDEIEYLYNRGAGLSVWHQVGNSNIEQPKPTIDEYVNGKCFGCGTKTDGKYCCAMCEKKSRMIRLREYHFGRSLLERLSRAMTFCC